MRVEVFVTNWNLPRYVEKSYCVRKRKKKMNIEDLIIEGI